MEIKKTVEGTTLTIAVSGRLDTMTSPDLEAELKKSMPEAEALILDFEELDYISSAGLRVLLMAHKEMTKKKGMKIIHVRDIIMEIFEVTNFVNILTIE